MDWSEKVLNKARFLKEPYEKAILVYRLKGEDWEQLFWPEVYKLTVNEICTGPYLFKIEGTGYLCGNDEVWKKQEGKPRAWIHDLVQAMFKRPCSSGLSWKDVLAFDFKQALTVMWAHRVLDGTFVNEEESCRLNQNQTSIPI